MFNNNIDLLIASSCGILAFMGSVIAFSPIVINAIRISVNRKFIIKLAEIGSTIAICLGLIHGLIETQKRLSKHSGVKCSVSYFLSHYPKWTFI